MPALTRKTFSPLIHTQPLTQVKCIARGVGVSQKAKIYIKYIILRSFTWHQRCRSWLLRQSYDITKTVLHLCSWQGEKIKRNVGLPWVQSSGNYSLTWKTRQLIHSGKLSVLHKFLSLSLTSLISAVWNCVTPTDVQEFAQKCFKVWYLIFQGFFVDCCWYSIYHMVVAIKQVLN